MKVKLIIPCKLVVVEGGRVSQKRNSKKWFNKNSIISFPITYSVERY